MARKVLFAVTTPIGHRVVLARNRWREIIRYKHPALTGHLEDVRKCLKGPQVINSSTKDPKVHLYYLALDQKYVCVVVGGEDPQERFVVTAYLTREIKKGQEAWKK